MTDKFSLSDLYKDADGAITEPHLVQVLYKSGVPIAIDLPSFATEAMKQMQDSLIRAALEVAASCAEQYGRESYAAKMISAAIRALADNPATLAAIKAKAAEVGE
jgi:hypothetical protein